MTEAGRPARRRAAILAADLVGYTRLMAADEEGTLARTRDSLENAVRPSVGRHRGRIFKTTGDGFLAEFAHATDALHCADEIHRSVAAANSGHSDNAALRYRIGINVGDVIVEDGDLFGNGVNIAARLEQLAEPGGVCLSEEAYRQLNAKLDIRVEDIGAAQLHNIADPVRAFHVRPPTWTAAPDRATTRGRRGVRWAGIAGCVALAAAAVWAVFLRHDPDPGRPAPLAAVIADAFDPSPASIVVEPFINLSADPAHDPFAAGLTEDLTTALARNSSLRVVAYRASFPRVGEMLDAVRIARGHRVRYVIEGSVQRDAARIRINAQVIDARDGAVVWAHRFDREHTDDLAVQGEVTTLIAQAVNQRLANAGPAGRAPGAAPIM
jgi:class 3 adenylate cyclase/TolB-like protein